MIDERVEFENILIEESIKEEMPDHYYNLICYLVGQKIMGIIAANNQMGHSALRLTIRDYILPHAKSNLDKWLLKKLVSIDSDEIKEPDFDLFKDGVDWFTKKRSDKTGNIIQVLKEAN